MYVYLKLSLTLYVGSYMSFFQMVSYKFCFHIHFKINKSFFLSLILITIF